jgi:hypothetical protein
VKTKKKLLVVDINEPVKVVKLLLLPEEVLVNRAGLVLLGWDSVQWIP